MMFMHSQIRSPRTMKLAELSFRTQIAVTRATTRALRFVGLRDRILVWRLAWRRALRTAVENRGSDRLSRPALHDLDVKLNAIIACDGGFFVEAGANDGYTQSNTYWLERFRGWQGLLVEPMSELATEAQKSRLSSIVKQCALVSPQHDGEKIRMHFGDLMSIVDGARDRSWASNGTVLGWRDPYDVDVEAHTLSSLLDEINAPEVDLLSLDVEGYEISVLKGLDFQRHAPRYILVEIQNRDRGRPPIDALLDELYDEHSWLSPMDILYVRRDVAKEALDG
jgi:FkbM family methyltransferase